MTTDEKIMAVVEEVLGWENGDVGRAAGQCLKDVRLIIEKALGWGDGEFYSRHRTDIVETPSADSPFRWTRAPHARDMERSLRVQGMEVSRDEVQPGDLLFNFRGAPYNPDKWDDDFPGVPFPPEPVCIGHVGIYVGLGMMLENINPYYRTYGFNRKYLSLTPLSQYEKFQGKITTVIRFAPKEGP